MNDILIDYLDVFYIIYLDDILIYLKDPFKYELHVKLVLQRLYKVSLQVNIKKLEFSVTYTKFLRFVVTTNSMEINPEKVESLRN